VLTVANGAVLIALAAYLLAARRMHFWTFLPLALVIGGGIGNLIDRVRFGYVIDFFNLGIGNLRTGIFNVADMAITAGFLIMLPLAFLPDPQPQPGADDTSGPGAEPKAASSADRPVESRSA
jgi:signal peptidase II